MKKNLSLIGLLFLLSACSGAPGVLGIGGLTAGGIGGGSIAAQRIMYLLNPVRPAVRTIKLSAAVDANNNTVIPADLVIVYDQMVFAEIMKLSASKYFETKLALQRDHSANLQIISWEIVPGQSTPTEDVSFSHDSPVGAVLFANYDTPGDHRIRLTQERNVQVLLEEKEWNIVHLPDEE